MENNTLIAEFMGGQRVLPDEDVYNMPTHNNLCYGVNELQYDTSWDWLMPVVEKIENGGLDPHELIDGSLRKNNQKRWRSIEDLYNVAVHLIKIHNNGK